MRDLEREAFRRGYKDYAIYALQKDLHIAAELMWRPPEGHEDAYAGGWEVARLRALERREAREAA